MEAVELEDVGSSRRRYWTMEEKRQIVEQTLSASASVAALARQHGVNANQLFYWRKLYRTGQLGGENAELGSGLPLLPVSVEDDEPVAEAPEASDTIAPSLTMNIEFPGRVLVSLEGAIDADIVRIVLESLRR